MNKRITIPAIFLIVMVIILLLLKCGGRNEQTCPQPLNEDLNEDSTAVVITSNVDTVLMQLPDTTPPQPIINESELIRKSQVSLNRFLTSITPPPQVFMVTGSGYSTVSGEKGTTIYVNPAVLETFDGEAPTDSIRVELVEITNQRDMILNGVSTMAGDSVLISDGMFRIEMYADTEKLRIKKGEGIEVTFPRSTKENMDLFYGVPGPTGAPDWVLNDSINVVFRYNNSYKYSVIAEPLDGDGNVIASNSNRSENVNRQNSQEHPDNLANRLYRFLIPSLGWYNFDKFLTRNSPRSNLTVTYNGDSIKAVNIYVIFKDLNTNIQRVSERMPLNHTFKNLPANQNIKVLAMGYHDTIPFISEKDLFIARRLSHELIFKQTTEKELTKKLNSL